MNLQVMFSSAPLHIDVPVLAAQKELTYNSSVWSQCSQENLCKVTDDGTNAKRDSGKSMLAAQPDDDIIDQVDQICN